MKWTHTIETVVDVETSQAKGQWKIGDAIAKDLLGEPGPPDRKIYAECASFLESKGFDRYDASYLAMLHRTSEAFSRSERDGRYSWDVHYQAGTPANLKQAATALRKLGKTVTKYNVRWLMKEWRAKADAERRERYETAKAEEAAAKSEAAKAAERQMKAKNKADREKQKAARAKAKADAKAAKERRNAASRAPKYNTDVPTDLQDENTMRAMAIYFGVTLHARRMLTEAGKAQTKIDQIAEHLTPTQQQEIKKLFTEVIELSRAIVAKASPRFKVHEGGVA